jgi:hypothetical protein
LSNSVNSFGVHNQRLSETDGFDERGNPGERRGFASGRQIAATVFAAKPDTGVGASSPRAMSAPWKVILDQPGSVLSGDTIDGDASNQNEQRVGGVLIAAPFCKVLGCTIRNTSGVGIGVARGAWATQLVGNTIEDTWMQGIGFFERAEDYSLSLVSHNFVRRTGLDSISIGGIGSLLVLENDIADCQFGGVYALTGTQDARIVGNKIKDCYSGVDISWGIAGGRGAGSDLTHGMVIQRNRVSRCVGGISTGSNGTIMIGNIVTDCGRGARQTYTLMGTTPSVAVPGHNYAVGNVLRLPLDGAATRLPGKVVVREIDGTGGIVRVEVWYVGVYFTPPQNPITLAGGSGSGASINVPAWNERSVEPIGMGLTDACDCIVSGNISGNTDSAHMTQKVGFLVKRVFTAPLRNQIIGNNFSRNRGSAVTGYHANQYTSRTLPGNVIAQNIT